MINRRAKLVYKFRLFGNNPVIKPMFYNHHFNIDFSSKIFLIFFKKSIDN